MHEGEYAGTIAFHIDLHIPNFRVTSTIVADDGCEECHDGVECKEELLCTGAMVSEGYVPTARSFRSRAAPLLPLHDWQVGPSTYTTNYMLHVSHYSYKNHAHILSHRL